MKCRISEDLDQIFTVANCLNYVVSTVIICTIGFLVIIAGASMEIVRYLPVVLSCIYQIYMVGWMGDKIAFSVSSLLSRIEMSFVNTPFSRRHS